MEPVTRRMHQPSHTTATGDEAAASIWYWLGRMKTENSVTFDGTGGVMRASRWVQRMRIIFERIALPSELWARVAEQHIWGDAWDWWSTSIDRVDVLYPRWRQLSVGLIQRFETGPRLQAWEASLAAWAQQPGEHVYDYFRRFATDIVHGCPRIFLEEERMAVLWRGLTEELRAGGSLMCYRSEDALYHTLRDREEDIARRSPAGVTTEDGLTRTLHVDREQTDGYIPRRLGVFGRPEEGQPSGVAQELPRGGTLTIEVTDTDPDEDPEEDPDSYLDLDEYDRPVKRTRTDET